MFEGSINKDQFSLAYLEDIWEAFGLSESARSSVQLLHFRNAKSTLHLLKKNVNIFGIACVYIIQVEKYRTVHLH